MAQGFQGAKLGSKAICGAVTRSASQLISYRGMPTGQVASTEMSSSRGWEVSDQQGRFWSESSSSGLWVASVSVCSLVLLGTCKVSELWHLISCSSLSSTCEYVLAYVCLHVHVEARDCHVSCP